ncbi:hypothetical protein GQ53DRAFT_830967 [Thozetella sp. PMI_491]|nr:hypothetical protein GQ53DRAFT_830967 [Thozetella sp. PMI_491]
MASNQGSTSRDNGPFPYPEPGLELYQPAEREQQHQYYAYAGPNVVKPLQSTSPTINQQPYAPSSQAQPGHYQAEDSTRLKGRKIIGIRWSKFWVGLTVIVTIAIIAVLAGTLGASLNGDLKTSKNDVPPPASSDTLALSRASSTVLSTSSQASSSSSAPPTSTPSITTVAGPDGISIQCPSADGLSYTAAGNKTFKRICNYDFVLNDIYNVTVKTMEECMDSCASSSKCVGATWDYAGLLGPESHFCFVKDFIGIKSAAQNVESAMLLQ